MTEIEKHPIILVFNIIMIAIGVLCLVSIFTHPYQPKKQIKSKPVDGTKIVSSNIAGNVESIHPWGRTEVVSMKSVELEYFEYCDEWVMYGDVVQPIGRKDYFMPVIKGRLNLNVKDMTQTWIEYGSYATGLDKTAETFEDFRIAFIKVKEGKVINIKYTHYRLLSNNTWNIVSSWNAQFNQDIPDFFTDYTNKQALFSR